MDRIGARSTSESPRLAEELIALLREPAALLDAHLRLVAASPAFFLRFSLDRDSSIGERVWDLGAGEWDTPGARELLEELAPTREVVEGYVLEVRSPRVEPSRLRVAVRPVREGWNGITSFVLVFDELPTAVGPPDLLHRFHSRAPELVAVLDQEQRFVEAGGDVRGLLGCGAGELAGLRLGGFVHHDERESVEGALGRLLAGAPHVRITFPVRHRQGLTLWLEAICHAWRDEGGASHIHLVGRDVTERRRAEEALRWLSRQTKLVLDSAGEGIFGLDSGGRITFVNPAAARSLGYRVSELLGRSYRVLLAGVPAGAVADDPVGPTLADGLERELRDARLLAGDGSTVEVEMTVSAARDRGRPCGAVVTFRPSADRKRAEAVARRAEWLAGVGETALALRHEINNPLTTLLAEARLLEMGGNSAEEEREMVASMCEGARRISDVLRRLAERQADPLVLVDGGQRMLDLSV